MSTIISEHQRSSHCTRLQPFDQVPAELLSAIIEFTRLPMYFPGPANQDTADTCLVNMEDLTACNPVCSYWRRTAFSLTSLWTEFVLTDETAPMFVTRSASLLLRLIGLETEEGDTRAPALEALCIVAPRAWADGIVGALFQLDVCVPCPKLRNLRVQVVHATLSSAAEEEGRLSEQTSDGTSECGEEPQPSNTYAHAPSVNDEEFSARLVYLIERRRPCGCPAMHIVLNFGSPESLEMFREHIGHVEVIVRDIWHLDSQQNSFVQVQLNPNAEQLRYRDLLTRG